MAFWHKRTVKGRTYLYVYTRKNGKQVTVPREQYKHLDGAPDHNVSAWVTKWALQNEHTKATPDSLLFSDDVLTKRLDEWHAHFVNHLGRDERTANDYRSLILRYAIPYFLEQSLKDPAQWPGVSIHLFDYLVRYGCSQVLIAKINLALRTFFRWHQDEGLVAWEGTLRLRNTRKVAKPTPLAHMLTPEDVLKFVKAMPSPKVKLLALLGYFLSLRPQESFAVRPEDFASGSRVKDKECSKAMSKAKLYAGLAMHVQRQRTATNKTKPPKSHSRGWVSCFDKRAAGLLASLLNPLPDGPVFDQDNRALYRLWETSTKGTPLEKIDLKDLRRASIYWLGHHSKLSPIQLMKHARHKEFETTQLYLRRPEEEAPAGRMKLA